MQSIPFKVLATAGLVLLIPIVAVLAWLWLQWGELAPPVQTTLRLLVFGVPIASAAAAAYVGIVAAYNRLARLEIVKADKNYRTHPGERSALPCRPAIAQLSR
jgi:hypothetical protein